MNSGGTKTSRSLTTTRLVTKTMTGPTPPVYCICQTVPSPESVGTVQTKCSITRQCWNSTKPTVPSPGSVGTVQNQLFHHQAVLEQYKTNCSNTFQNHLWAWCGLQACRRRFFSPEKNAPVFVDMSILKNHRIVRISIFLDLGTCLKRRAPKNHEFWRYSDLQISHGEPFGEQNDELNFGRQTGNIL